MISSTQTHLGALITNEQGGGLSSGASQQYNVMSVIEIGKLPIQNIANDDCVLFMWWVASQPEEAIALVKAWGFTIKTMSAFNWVKTTKSGKLDFGMGFWTRAGSELCLVAVRGKPKRINAGIRSVIMAERGKHSAKPDIFRQEIVHLMGDKPRVELFARDTCAGWDAFGNEVNNSITL